MIEMLDQSNIGRIVRDAVEAHAPPQSVRDVLSEPDIDLDGADALRITIVITPEAVESLRSGTVLDALVAIQNGLRGAGEELFPFVSWSTEDELKSVAESES